MTTQSVSVEDSYLVIFEGAAAVKAQVDAVQLCLVATLSHPVHQGDEPFLIIIFKDSTWVVPQVTPGLNVLLDALGANLQPGQIHAAELSTLPFSWRRKILGVILAFPVPRLAIHPLPSSPPWKIGSRLSPAELLEAM